MKNMIHKVYWDNEQVILKEKPRYKCEAGFENTANDIIAPEGYMTSEDFRKLAIAKVNKFCDKHGLL